MWLHLLNRLLGKRKQPGRLFNPLYSVSEIAAIGRLPILRVLAFAGDDERTASGRIGAGVGGILASLLRRDLIFTRRFSVVGGEDTGYLKPDGRSIDDQRLLRIYGDSAVVVGHVEKDSGGQVHLRGRVVQRGAPLGSTNTFAAQVPMHQLSALMPTAAAAVCKLLDVTVEQSVAERWRRHTLTDWEVVQRAARSWEEDDPQELANLLKDGLVHPDAVACVNEEGPKRKTVHWALARAHDLEPDNPQLAFCTFCALCDYHQKPIPPRFESMLRAGLAAGPGHGKSHMVLPHVLAARPENVPYILAHSEAGYRLLRGNSFAMSNFSGYLMRLAPQDPRIVPLLEEAISCDRENPSGYQSAINFFMRQMQPAQAVTFAEALLKLCTPPVSERTMECFRSFPAINKQIVAGQFESERYALDILAKCRVAVAKC